MRAENQMAGAAPAAAGVKNLVELLLDRARSASAAAITHKKNGQWVNASWGEVLQEVKVLSAAAC